MRIGDHEGRPYYTLLPIMLVEYSRGDPRGRPSDFIYPIFAQISDIERKGRPCQKHEEGSYLMEEKLFHHKEEGARS